MAPVSTPVCDFVEKYVRQNPLRLHMPGHKGLGETERLDITEVTGAPAIYPAGGILLESERRAAALFGAGRTVYSAEGSSLCVRAMLLLAKLQAMEAGRAPVILAGRNAHRSFLSALALTDLSAEWLWGDSLLTCTPSPDRVAKALDAMETPPAAVYLTSPDYLGFRADITGIARLCHDRGVPLLVDNAHGAYLRFLPRDQHPLSLGADLVCDSAHKTLPVLTGGAYLHIHRDAPAVFAREAERAMSLFASTSPSWLILQSLDRANALLEEDFPSALADFLPLAEASRDRIRAMGYDVLNTEELKVTLAPKSRGCTGEELHRALRETGIEGEFADPDFLVLMLSPATGAAGLARLEEALARLPRRAPLREAPPSPPRARRMASPREAMLNPTEVRPLEQCLGRVLADPCVSCPPAVPILMCGEVIGEDAIRCFAYYGRTELTCSRLPGRNEREEETGWR
ncbi:MAG: PLP-dependent transferase [Clostridia bacterium]|nr:PLP-dependent transferase [Clostridia bacterium]